MRSTNSGNGSTNRHYMAIHTQPPHSITTLPNGCRTPMAWQNRENLSRPPSVQQPLQLQHHHHHHHQNHRRSGRPSSPSVTTTSSDDREEVPMVRHPHRRQNSRMTGNCGNQTVDRRSLYSQPNGVPYHGTLIPGEYSTPCPTARGLRTGTLRSTKSVPALAMATWDGEPCPVHGGGLLMPQCHPCLAPLSAPPPISFRRFGSVMDIRNNGNHHEKKYSGGLLPIYCPSMGPVSPLPPPIPLHHMMAPKFHPRPLVFPAFSEPLPVRDPYKVSSPVPSNHTTKYGTNSDDFNEDVCCKGHLVVLWIILGVVTVGVISGIILAVTMN